MSFGSQPIVVWPEEVQEMVPWIRGWGADVEVLEPASLRERVAEEHRRAAGIYR